MDERAMGRLVVVVGRLVLAVLARWQLGALPPPCRRDSNVSRAEETTLVRDGK